MTKNTQITAICDGAKNCWSVIEYLAPYCKKVISILDWFHISMKFKNTAMPEAQVEEFEKAKWHIWHGDASKSLEKLEIILSKVALKYRAKLNKLIDCIDNNRNYFYSYQSLL